jgi:hypothetical protein
MDLWYYGNMALPTTPINPAGDGEESVLALGTGTGQNWREAPARGLSLPADVLDELALARADGSYPKLMDRLEKTELVVLDDYGLTPLSHNERRNLLEVIEDRTGRKATLVTRQLPFEHWHDVVGDATFADAIPDRLVHHAHRITLRGASMRRKEPTSPSPEAATA